MCRRKRRMRENRIMKEAEKEEEVGIEKERK